MGDLEKVLKGLECCTQHGSMCGRDCNGHWGWTDGSHTGMELLGEYRTKCPYGNCETGCVKTLAKDALALLETQQPRVLTIEEVRDNCPDFVYIETNTGWLECAIIDSGESNRYFCVLVYGRDEYFMKLWEGYGKMWRCWNKCPTDEQREAVAWE